MKIGKILTGGVFVLMLVVFGGHYVYATDYSYSKTTVAEGWEHGKDEYWHLQAINEKCVFHTGEKVQFFAQVGPISVNHKWRLQLYRNGSLYQETESAFAEINNCYTWNYSNFVPYLNNLPVGDYHVDYFLDEGNGFEKVGENDFIVVLSQTPFVLDHALTAKSWQYGEGDEYWNLQPIEAQNEFAVGDTVYLLVQIRDVYVNHRYKVELYKDNNLLWEYETQWQDVGAGWKYGNFYPFYKNAQGGDFVFKTYIDTGDGYKDLAQVPFKVLGGEKPYTYDHTYLATSWKHGEGEEYWDLKPVNECEDACEAFTEGKTIYALAQVRNIYVNHSWRAELYRDNNLMWSYDTLWQDVGGGWTYGNFYPFYKDAQPGNYTFKIYINVGDGYELLDTKNFSVCGNYDDYLVDYIETAHGWKHGESEFWNIEPVNVSAEFNQGDDVYLVAQLKNVYVNHRYKVELYNYGSLIWSYESPWNNVGAGWDFSSFYPVYNNISCGDFEYKLYLDDGNGYKLLGEKSFVVN